jgi:formylglycine-generating enzyme required for sulfatase activity/transglutaminase-like putative cysteine protease
MKNRVLSFVIVFWGIVNVSTTQNVLADICEQKISGVAFTDSVTGMEFVRVQGGCFQMGDTFGNSQNDETPLHKVCLNDYYIGKTEVTFHMFSVFVEQTNYLTDAEREGHCWGIDKEGNWNNVTGRSWKHLSFTQQGDHPVVCVSWHDVQAFIQWLNQQSSGGFRLLTEAEWEYAARSRGQRRQYATQTGELNRTLANYGAEQCCEPDASDGHVYTASVGSYPANNIGVYDLSGNVWEWTADWYDEHYYTYSPQENPQGPMSGKYRIIRGGSWNIPKRFSRCSNRRQYEPGLRHVNIGFRLAKDINKNVEPLSVLSNNNEKVGNAATQDKRSHLQSVLPLGDALLVPIGRSLLGQSGVEICINERLFHYEKMYDGYGGYWAKIPCDVLGDTSVVRIRYIRRQDARTTYRYDHETAAAWMTPSYFIDSEHSAIREHAQQIYDDTQTIEENVKALSDFVTGYLTFNQHFHRAPASLTASQTLFQREGVCINFSRLFIALCRACGIAARSISGIVLSREHPDQYDFHHEWAEYMDEDGVWHPVDLTYTQTMHLSDIRYTDLVYAAEDHAYFAECTNESLATGQPISLENNDILLFHYHPIFPGAQYGFTVIEDHRPEFFVLEKTINVIKEGEHVIITQTSAP